MMISKNHTPDHASDSTIHPSPSEIAAWDSKADTNHTHSLASFPGIGVYNPPSYNLERALYSTNIDPNDNNNFDEVVLFISKQNNILSKETAYSDMYLLSTTAMSAVSATRSGPVMLLLPNGNLLTVVAASDTVLNINEVILKTNGILSRGTINITGPSGSNLSISAKLMPNGLVLIGYKFSPTLYKFHTYNCMSNELLPVASSITVTASSSINIATLSTTTMIVGVTSAVTECSLWLYDIETSTFDPTPAATISGLITSANYIRVFEMTEGQVMVSTVDQGSANSSFHTYNELFGLTSLPITVPNPGLPPDVIRLPGTTKYLITSRFSSGVYRIYIYDDSETSITQSVGAPQFFAGTSSYCSMKLLPNGKILIMFQFNPTTYYFLIYNPETDELEEIRTPTATVSSGISKPSIVVAPDNTIYAIARSSATVYSIYRLNGSFGKMNQVKLPIQHLLSRWI